MIACIYAGTPATVECPQTCLNTYLVYLTLPYDEFEWLPGVRSGQLPTPSFDNIYTLYYFSRRWSPEWKIKEKVDNKQNDLGLEKSGKTYYKPKNKKQEQPLNIRRRDTIEREIRQCINLKKKKKSRDIIILKTTPSISRATQKKRSSKLHNNISLHGQTTQLIHKTGQTTG